MTSSLLTPILEEGVRNTHFFNGRLLTAEDLRQEQAANRTQHRRLGQAIGEGVVHGLEVTQVSGSGSSKRTVCVKPGLAINRCGHALVLPVEKNVELVREPETTTDGGLFERCVALDDTATPTGTGVYILVIAPASGFEGRVLASGLTSGGQAAGCGSRYAVEGVQFRLLAVNLSMGFQLPGNADTLRNRLAHFCFGTKDAGAFMDDPFTSPEPYGLLDSLRASETLTDCDVPLALVYWAGGGINLLDMWSVRRRLVQPLVSQPWPFQASERRQAEAEAVFLQFQDHLEQFPSETDLSTVEARNYFRYLPPVGFLPVSEAAFNLDTFFSGLSVEPFYPDDAFVRLVLHQSWFMEPINLGNLDTAPTILVYAPPQGEYALFVRQRWYPQYYWAPDQEAPAEEPPEEAQPQAGSIRITVEAPAGSQDLILEKGREFRLWAEDVMGNEYDSVLLTGDFGLEPHPSNEIVFQGRCARFKIESLLAGGYRVCLRAAGFVPSDKECVVVAGQKTQVRFRLTEAGEKPGGWVGEPPVDGPGQWIDPGEWYEKIRVMEEYLRWPWPEEWWPEQPIDPPPEPWWYDDPAIDPLPDDVYEWFKDLGSWIKDKNPDIPIDVGDIGIFMNSDYVPGEMTDNPYAYLAFGRGGAYMPLVLIAADKGLDLPVAVGDVGMGGVDHGVAGKLGEHGARDVEVLGSAWKGLVRDALGVSGDVAESVIAEAREKVNNLQGSLRVFGGVDEIVEDALVEAGWSDAVALANATADQIVAGVGAGAGMSKAFAELLIHQARQVAPDSTWSLGKAGLGMLDEQLASLEKAGIRSQGDLIAAVSDAEGKALVGRALGITADKVDALAELVGGKLSDASFKMAIARVEAAPVTNLFGIDRMTGTALARLGVGSVGLLAGASVESVAPAFGGDESAAAAAIAAATEAMGGLP